MRRLLFAIKDTLADDITGTVLSLRNEPEAVRFFRDLLQDSGNQVGKHPADHELLLLGEVKTVNDETYIDTNCAKTVLTGGQWLQMMSEETADA